MRLVYLEGRVWLSMEFLSDLCKYIVFSLSALFGLCGRKVHDVVLVLLGESF